MTGRASEDGLRAMLEARAGMADSGLAAEVMRSVHAAIAVEAPSAGRLSPLDATRPSTRGSGSLPVGLLAAIVVTVLIIAVVGGRGVLDAPQPGVAHASATTPAGVATLAPSPSPAGSTAPSSGPASAPPSVVAAAAVPGLVADGSLEGRLLVIEAAQATILGPCATGIECWRLELAGLDGLPATWTRVDVIGDRVEAGQAVRGDLVVTVRDGALELLGRLPSDTTPVLPGSLPLGPSYRVVALPGTEDDDGLTVGLVAGWLVEGGPDTCPVAGEAGREACLRRAALVDGAPPAGADDRIVAVTVRGAAPGLDAFLQGTDRSGTPGPFLVEGVLVRRCVRPMESECRLGYDWVVRARYDADEVIRVRTP